MGAALTIAAYDDRPDGAGSARGVVPPTRLPPVVPTSADGRAATAEAAVATEAAVAVVVAAAVAVAVPGAAAVAAAVAVTTSAAAAVTTSAAVVVVVALVLAAALPAAGGMQTCPAGGGDNGADGDGHDGGDGVRLWPWSDGSGGNVDALERAGGTGVGIARGSHPCGLFDDPFGVPTSFAVPMDGDGVRACRPLPLRLRIPLALPLRCRRRRGGGLVVRLGDVRRDPGCVGGMPPAEGAPVVVVVVAPGEPGG